MANSPAPPKWPTDLKQTEDFKKYNTSTKYTECVPLENLINKLSAGKNQASPSIVKYLIETCNNMKEFMINYKQYQLSFTTQNVLIGEFFAPAIFKLYQEIANLTNSLNKSRRQSDTSTLDASIDGREDLLKELNDARNKILSLEAKIESLVDTQQEYLKNAVALREAKGVLEESYVARCETLEHVADTAAQNYETRYLEKVKVLDMLKEERLEQTRHEDQTRLQTMQDMKTTFDQLCSSVFKEESAHIDRVLKGVHKESEIHEQMMKDVIKDFDTLDAKISTTVADLQKEITNIKFSAQAISSTTSTAAPSSQSSSNSKIILPRPYVVLVYPEPPFNSFKQDELQDLLRTSSKTLNLSFRSSGIYRINNGFKISLPSQEDQISLKTIFNDPALNSKFKTIIPKVTNALFCIKFTNLTSPEDVTEDLTLKNPDFITGSFKVIFSMRAKTETHWVIEIDPQYYQTLAQTSFVYIGYKICPFEPFVSVNHCKKCGNYGHTAKRCSETISKCLRCGRPSHDNDQQCSLKCLNCSLNNSKQKRNEPTDHKSGYYRCTEFYKQRRRAFQRSGHDPGIWERVILS
ncbi:hypothetical protein JTE90_018877 [Oedothorax gibbosus]|uniref:CCHC-type domain-containing protein n=1 Tax=Oedothorax gibbosus TaxID=931172 RepID=A0AAV6TVW1_9ARAC|nr:hypothetical protein JTE90_018877 [Oedothorax gibbosus]